VEKERWQAYLVGTLANAGRPLPPGDAEKILESPQGAVPWLLRRILCLSSSRVLCTLFGSSVAPSMRLRGGRGYEAEERAQVVSCKESLLVSWMVAWLSGWGHFEPWYAFEVLVEC